MPFEPDSATPTSSLAASPAEPIPLPALEPEIDLWVAPEPQLPAAIDDEGIDDEGIVEEVELLLREGAPHDFDVLVIGGGPGGCAAALGAARGGLHVALVEKERLGGAYLGGCLSSKMLLQAGQTGAPHLGQLQARKRELSAQLRGQIQQELEVAGVEILTGRARFVEEHSLEIETEGQVRRVLAVHVVIAVGGRAEAPDVPGASSPGVVTPNQILEQETVPPRLVVMGAGTIGTEIASAFAALGAQVDLLDCEAVLPGEDEEIQAAVLEQLQSAGVQTQIGAEVTRIDAQSGVPRVVFARDGAEHQIEAEQVVLATGWMPHLDELNLEAAGVEVSGGKIEVGADFQTNISGVYALGDCIRRDGWASQAMRDGHDVAAAILGLDSAPPAHFAARCCFAPPETAAVGLLLREALDLGIAARATRRDRSFNLRAALNTAPNAEVGWIKLVFEIGTLRLLGCHIVGAGASEIIGEAALAIRAGLTLHDLAATLHGHPALSQDLADAARSISSAEPPFETPCPP